MTKKVYLYVFDTMADWETSYLIAELNSGRYFKKEIAPFNVKTIAIDNQPITTMGGIKIVPDIRVDECVLNTSDILILPGGNTWGTEIHEPILKIAADAIQKNRIVAAICGSTIGLAKFGLLDLKKHTSNDLEYLKMIVPNYKGEKYYQTEVAVTDGNLITASGTAPLEFAMQVLKALDVFALATLDAWYNLYKTQDSKYFFELMNSIT